MSIAIIVLTKNSQSVIKDCLQSLKPADEIIVVDDNSTDKTLAIAKLYPAKIFRHKLISFPHQRHWAAAKVTKDWLMFIDADERLTKAGWQEIKQRIKTEPYTAYRFKRLNHFYGKLIKHGGYWPDFQTRLFKRTSFQGIKGVTHEQYLFSGSLGTLKTPVPHFPDRSLKQGLVKSNIWTPKEAEALFQANHPQVTILRLVKVMVCEFVYRYFTKGLILDGYIGFAESLTQAINKFFIYQQLWELQQKK